MLCILLAVTTMASAAAIKRTEENLARMGNRKEDLDQVNGGLSEATANEDDLRSVIVAEERTYREKRSPVNVYTVGGKVVAKMFGKIGAMFGAMFSVPGKGLLKFGKVASNVVKIGPFPIPFGLPFKVFGKFLKVLG